MVNLENLTDLLVVSCIGLGKDTEKKENCKLSKCGVDK